MSCKLTKANLSVLTVFTGRTLYGKINNWRNLGFSHTPIVPRGKQKRGTTQLRRLVPKPGGMTSPERQAGPRPVSVRAGEGGVPSMKWQGTVKSESWS